MGPALTKLEATAKGAMGKPTRAPASTSGFTAANRLNAASSPGDAQELFTVLALPRRRRTDAWSAGPVPIDGELLTSWLSRLAWANALGPAALLQHLRPFCRDPVDLDRDPAPRLVAYLAAQTGVAPARLQEMQRFAHGAAAWSRRTAAIRCCPLCWRSGTPPHAPWPWRFDVVVACPRHGCWLRDRCDCGATLDLLAGLRRRPMWRCHACGQDLRASASRRASSAVLRGQNILLDTVTLAEELDRPALITRMAAVVEDVGSRGGAPAAEAGGVAAVLGGAMFEAYALLDGVSAGPVRRHLLRLLRAGTLDDAATVEPLPVRCWPQLDAAVLPPRLRVRLDDAALTMGALTSAYNSVLARHPTPMATLSRLWANQSVGHRRAAPPEVTIRSALKADAANLDRLLERRSQAGFSRTYLGWFRHVLGNPRCHAWIAATERRVLALLLFTDQVLTVFVVDPDVEEHTAHLLGAAQAAARQRVLEVGAIRFETGVTERHRGAFEATGWRPGERHRYPFACDALMSPDARSITHMVLEFVTTPPAFGGT